MSGNQIPDSLSFIPSLFTLASALWYPDVPELSDIGVDRASINRFFNLKRAIGRAGIQRQGAQAMRVAAGNLPSSLRQSTIPASISAGIQTRLADRMAQMEAELAGEEQNALFKLYDILNQQFQNKVARHEAIFGQPGEGLDVLSFLPLLL